MYMQAKYNVNTEKALLHVFPKDIQDKFNVGVANTNAHKSMQGLSMKRAI